MAAPSCRSRRYRFGDFVLSPARRSLRARSREVPLIPRYLDLLILLVERRAEALARQEIFDRVWSDVVVSDGALTQAVRTLRRTLGEDGGGGVFIRTVSRHGYQFVCPVTEEEDFAEPEPVSADSARAVLVGPTGNATTLGAPDPDVAHGGSEPLGALVARLLAPGGSEDECREAAEEAHRLGTGEALLRIAGQSGHARAWALLRDTRWDVPGAGEVPLLGPGASLSAWTALVGLRLRQALRLVGGRWAAASAGGALAGLIAGVLGASLITLLPGRGWPPLSLVLGLGLVAAFVAGLGAAGVGSGLAAGEALVRSWRTPALVILGATGGGAVGALAHRAASSLMESLFAAPGLALGGGVEGLVMGAAAGLGYGLSTRRPTGGMASPRGLARLRVCLATGATCALAALLLGAGGFPLGTASLQSVVARFPKTQVRLEVFAPLFGERGSGPRTRGVLGATEGLLFGAGLAAGLTRRPRRRSEDGS